MRKRPSGVQDGRLSWNKEDGMRSEKKAVRGSGRAVLLEYGRWNEEEDREVDRYAAN
jgi:hypothetical protein